METAGIEKETAYSEDDIHSVCAPGEGANRTAFWVVTECYAGSAVAWFPTREQADEYARVQDAAHKRWRLIRLIHRALADGLIPLADIEIAAELLYREMREREKRLDARFGAPKPLADRRDAY